MQPWRNSEWVRVLANASTNSVLSGYHLSGPIIREIWDNGQTVVAGVLNSNRATAVAESALLAGMCVPPVSDDATLDAAIT
jgi:hypothetical protein